MKTAVIDVGGGMRGIYASGVLDRCLEDKVSFDVCIGISAGSANLSSFISGQKGRNYHFYAEYSFRKEYMSLGNLLKTGSYLNLSYVYETLSNHDGENPVDWQALKNNPCEFIVVAEEAISGCARYFTKENMAQDDYRVLIASSNIPGINRAYNLDGTLYFDGALADPVPLQKAFDMGCEKIVLLLSKPQNVLRTPTKDNLLAKRIARKFPLSANNLRKRAERYNTAIAWAKELEAEGKVLIVAPESTEGIDTLAKNKQAFDRLYRRGLQDGSVIKPWLAKSSNF